MSNRIVVAPFRPEHLEKINPRANHNGEVPKTVLTTAWTYLVDDIPIAIFGGFVFVPGVIHFWGLFSDEIRKYPIEFHKQTIDVLKWYEEREKPRRFQFDVRVGYTEGCRWAESLGFKQEGIMRQYGMRGEDFYLYGRPAVCPH